MDLDDARTIGRRIRQVRKSRDKPLLVIAGLAGPALCGLRIPAATMAAPPEHLCLPRH